MKTRETDQSLPPTNCSADDWKDLATTLHDALKKLDGIYREEQDEPLTRPPWLRHAYERFDEQNSQDHSTRSD